MVSKEPIQEFNEYSLSRLNTHVSELKTTYREEAIHSALQAEAYETHRHIFENEMDEKIDSLVRNKNNPWVKEELEKAKSHFLTQLDGSKS